MAWSPGEPEQVKRDITLGNSIVTLKALSAFIDTILEEYFVSFGIFRNYSGLSIYILNNAS